MGYYTGYKIEIIEGDCTIDQLKESLNANNVYFHTDSYFTECGDYIPILTASYKRFNSTETMIKISELLPNCVFKVSGQGEDYYDSWIVYYCNGKLQNANKQIIIKYDEFDISKLVKYEG